MKRIAVILLTMGLGVLTAGAADGGAEKKKAEVKKGDGLPDWAKAYDKNGDGQLDRQETQAAVKGRRDEAIKPYDTNGDGVLDEAEKKAMIAKRRQQHEELTAQRKAELEKKTDARKEKEKEKEKEKGEVKGVKGDKGDKKDASPAPKEKEKQ